MSSVRDLVDSIKKLGEYMVAPPESEREAHHCLGTYLLTSGYNVIYVDKPVDFIVKIGKTEIPIEVKLNPSSERLNEVIDELYKDMREKGWNRGILVVVDTTKSHKAATEAERIGEKEKYGRRIYAIGVKK